MRFIATSLPSLSLPLYTVPNAPSPILLAGEKFSVALIISSKEKFPTWPLETTDEEREVEDAYVDELLRLLSEEKSDETAKHRKYEWIGAHLQEILLAKKF